MATRWLLLAVTLIFSASFFSVVRNPRMLSAQDAKDFPARGHVIVPKVTSPAATLRGASSDFPTSPPVQVPAPVLPRTVPVVPRNPGLPQDVFDRLVASAGSIFSRRVQS